jgi:hypothetical protein
VRNRLELVGVRKFDFNCCLTSLGIDGRFEGFDGFDGGNEALKLNNDKRSPELLNVKSFAVT